MPDFEHPHILLATLGGKPEIVTFTLDLLLQKHFPISEVIVIHPTSHPRLAQAVERLSAEFVDDHYTFMGEQRIIHFRRYPLRNYGQPIDDIVDTDSANATLTAMDELIDDLKRRLAVIHFSISGGRRLMSFLSISAALLNFTRRDHLWHICTPEAVKQRVWANGEMHVRLEDDVQLIEVPLARMAQPFLPIALDALHTQPQPKEREQGNEPRGVQRIQVENEQIENERYARCERVCREASSAQLKVLQALAKGMTPDQAAIHLNISVTTVRSHMHVVYDLIRNAWGLARKYPLNYRDMQIRFGDYFDAQPDPEQQ